MPTPRKAKSRLTPHPITTANRAACDERFCVRSMGRPGARLNIGENGLRNDYYP